MHINWIRNYCMAKSAVTEGFPFDDQALVFKVMGKMFAVTSLNQWEEGLGSINLKCDPELAIELRGEFDSVEPGYHLNKKHWNTIQLHLGEISAKQIAAWIDHSYDLVVAKLPKKDREFLQS